MIPCSFKGYVNNKFPLDQDAHIAHPLLQPGSPITAATGAHSVNAEIALSYQAASVCSPFCLQNVAGQQPGIAPGGVRASGPCRDGGEGDLPVYFHLAVEEEGEVILGEL
jgi:hypothetical protein